MFRSEWGGHVLGLTTRLQKFSEIFSKNTLPGSLITNLTFIFRSLRHLYQDMGSDFHSGSGAESENCEVNFEKIEAGSGVIPKMGKNI